MSEELKPCPFCGGRAEFDSDDSDWNWIECKSCSASTTALQHGEYDARNDLAKAWNTRHIPEGYVMVPVVPTQQQKHSAEAEIAAWCSSSRQSRHHQIADRVYQAMIAAAQARLE